MFELGNYVHNISPFLRTRVRNLRLNNGIKLYKKNLKILEAEITDDKFLIFNRPILQIVLYTQLSLLLRV